MTGPTPGLFEGWEIWADVDGAFMVSKHGGRFVIAQRGRLNEPEDGKALGHLFHAAPDLLAAHPTVPHPGGRLVKVVAHYEDGSTQTIDGEVVTAAVAKAHPPQSTTPATNRKESRSASGSGVTGAPPPDACSDSVAVAAGNNLEDRHGHG